MKLYTFSVPEGCGEGRLFRYACRRLPEVPEYAIREAFQKRDVKVDGRRVGMNAELIPGTEVCLYVRETQKHRLIPVLYEDENVLVAAKPAGISCDKDAHGGRTLPELLQEQMLEEKKDAAMPLLCHRLDNPTEGLILLAKNERVQLLLQDAFRNRQIHKTYTCLVRGTPEPAHRVLRAYLTKDAKRARVFVSDRETPGAKRIVTEYAVVEAGECARLLIRLHTGRTHQIRAHMAFIGHPLLGDDQYGDRALNRRLKAHRLMLCATELRFELTGEMSYLNEKTFTYQPGF